MDRQRWQSLTEGFDAALEYPPGDRDSYLARFCAGDDELLIEVSRLFAEFEKAGDFLENPPATPVQSVSVGDLIAGRYRIEILLGRAGMGEVYRAHDEFMDEGLLSKRFARYRLARRSPASRERDGIPSSRLESI